MPNIPFVSSAIENAGRAKAAWKAKNYAKAALHGTGSISDIAFPGFIGKTVYDSYKEGKMTAAEAARLRRSGFSKAAGIVGGTVKMLGSGIKGVGGTMARHPLATAGVGVGAAGMYGANRFGKAVKETRQQIGPTGTYQGQLQ